MKGQRGFSQGGKKGDRKWRRDIVVDETTYVEGNTPVSRMKGGP